MRTLQIEKMEIPSSNLSLSKRVFDSVSNEKAKPTVRTVGFEGNSEAGASESRDERHIPILSDAPNLYKQIGTSMSDSGDRIENKKPETGVSGFEEKPDSVQESDFNGADNTPIIADTPNFYKEKGVFVSSEPFFKLIKRVHDLPAWKGAKIKYRAFFYEVAARAVWKEESLPWNGESILLKPGQWCSSIRRLVKDFNPEGLKGKASKDVFSKNDIEGAIKYFVKVGFLRHEIRHEVSILTICQPVIYEENYNTNQTANQTLIRRQSDTNEERRERRDIKETNDRACALDSSPINLEFEESKKKHPSAHKPSNQTKFTEEQKKIFDHLWEFISKNGMSEGHTANRKPGIKEKDLEVWISKYDPKEILECLKITLRSQPQRTWPGYTTMLLRGRISKKEDDSVKGRELVESFVKKNDVKHIDLKKDYFKDLISNEQSYYSLPTETLNAILKRSVARKKERDQEEDQQEEDQ